MVDEVVGVEFSRSEQCVSPERRLVSPGTVRGGGWCVVVEIKVSPG